MSAEWCVVPALGPVECRLLVDPPQDGAWNMAVDEALLESAGKTGTPTLRFYRWAEPTLSLGYFQHYDDRDSHPASRDCPAVRRSTGGGAILHDRELTYCLVWPGAATRAAFGQPEATWLYRAVHRALQEALRGRGIESQLWPSTPVGGTRQPLLCFLRRAECDMVVGQSKILGSAQRRRRGAVLQHGSLLLAASAKAPELLGLAEILGQPLDAAEIVADWGLRLQETLGLALRRGVLDDDERHAAEKLLRNKHGQPDWIWRR